MPTTYQITDGPSAKGFIFSSALFAETRWTHTFTLNGAGRIQRVSFTIYHIGRSQLSEWDDDEYSFIASELLSVKRPPPNHWQRYFIAGRYNTRTCTGSVKMFTPEELRLCPLARCLFAPHISEPPPFLQELPMG